VKTGYARTDADGYARCRYYMQHDQVVDDCSFEVQYRNNCVFDAFNLLLKFLHPLCGINFRSIENTGCYRKKCFDEIVAVNSTYYFTIINSTHTLMYLHLFF